MLNESQSVAVEAIKDFLRPQPSLKRNICLLTGPAGSGKTTTIINAFNESGYKIIFTAFTNKAAQVLKNASVKFDVKFNAEFMTIHKLLKLEMNYGNDYDNIYFKFSSDKIEYLNEYDVIIFDECSTISKDLLMYIIDTWNFIFKAYKKALKLVFLGDRWQLPPVKESTSAVFDLVDKYQMLSLNLDKVMRSANETIFDLNTHMLNIIDQIKQQQLDFYSGYPHSIMPGISYQNFESSIEHFAKECKDGSDCVILTFRNVKRRLINNAVQMLINPTEDVILDNGDIEFQAGDRCCLDKPIEVCEVNEITLKSGIYYKLNNTVLDTIYNGEIFDVLDAKSGRVITPLNRLKYIPKYFDGQLLTIQKISDRSAIYKILHIKQSIITHAIQEIKKKEFKQVYLSLMSDFVKFYPKLEYGYCLTIYKAQGSEWAKVYIDVQDLKSIYGKQRQAIELFRSTYTAASRATTQLYGIQ